jgi:nitroreductase
MGLGSFWSTGKVFRRPEVRELLGLPDEMELVAAIWLGTPVEEGRSARKPASELTHWID